MGRSTGEVSFPAGSCHPERREGSLRVLQEETGAWHLWMDGVPRTGWANMAVDVALLDRAEQLGESWFRLYTWSPHCLSFGRHEPASRRYDLDRIRALELDTVRRPTGGRAVWHGRELTYAVAAPCARFGTMAGAYRIIHRLLSEALAMLGVESTLAPRAPTPSLDAGACFSKPVGGEVLVGGRKVIGSAQMMRGDALLQHGSILLHDDQRVVAQLSRHQSTSTAAVSATGLNDTLGQPVPPSAVAVAVARAATRCWPGTWEQVTEAGPVLRHAARYFAQFASSAWTWAR